MEMKVRFPGNRRVDAEFGGFTVQTDQLVAAGGDGTAPSPFDLFLASLATCSGYYVLAFCSKRDIPTDEITLDLSVVRDPERRMLSQVTIDIRLPASFPEQYVGACIKAASQCAVKKHLVDAPEIVLQASRGD